MFREAEARKFTTYTYTQVRCAAFARHSFSHETRRGHSIVSPQHVNREVKFEDKLLADILHQTEEFKIANGTESEEKRERLRQMSDEARRYSAVLCVVSMHARWLVLTRVVGCPLYRQHHGHDTNVR